MISVSEVIDGLFITLTTRNNVQISNQFNKLLYCIQIQEFGKLNES